MNNTLPPHNEDAERAFLGSALTNGDVPGRWRDGLEPGEFYVIKHGWIWDAVRRLAATKDAVDLLTVASQLQARNLLEETGGEAYLAQLSADVPSYLDENADSYAHIIKAFALRRRMLQALSEAAKVIYDTSIEIDQVIGKVTGAIAEATVGGLRTKPRLMGAVVSERIKRLEAIERGELSGKGLSTGLTDLDTLTYGLFPGDSVLIAARPRMGKSGLLQCVADNVSRFKHLHVLIFSLEMLDETWTDRLLASVSQVDAQKIRLGGLTTEEWQRVYDAEQKLQTQCWIDSSAGQTDAEIRTKARQLHAEVRLDLIVVDYIQKVKSAARAASRYQEVGNVSTSMKDMALELRVPVISAAMVGRGVEMQADKRPSLADLRESGNLEADADQVWMIHRDEIYNPNSEMKGVAEIIVDKNRNGPMGTVHVGYDPVRQSFYNIVKVKLGSV